MGMEQTSEASFEALMSEAEEHPAGGWDFSWLGDRLTMSKLPWTFSEIVVRFAHRSPDLLDLGTGGGEWLAALPHRPPRTVATEAWPPNVPVATQRLSAFGIEVVPVDPVPDNNQQDNAEMTTRLPFPDNSFHLVMDRHESFAASEVARILAPGGHFITQQFGDGLYLEFRELFDAPTDEQKAWTRSLAVSQVEQAALRAKESGETRRALAFWDVGALAWYLRMVPWIVPGFTIPSQRRRLSELHNRIGDRGPLVVHVSCFYLVAEKLSVS